MKTYYKNDLKQAKLILESETKIVEDYQLAMIRENYIPGILKTNFRFVDGMTQYYYDISGKTSFLTAHEKDSLCMADIRCLTEAILQTVKELQKYMLPAHSLLLDPEYIFCEKGSYYFCFYPPEEELLKEKFHRLTEYFVREVDYRDEEGVRLAYTLHKSTMEEHFTIERILEEFEGEDEGAQVVDYAERMDRTNLEHMLVAEKIEFWEPIRKLLEKRKRTCK